MRSWTTTAREVWEVPRDLLLGRYPPFVTGGPLPRGHIPVFVFHSLEPESFERRVRHLVDNGYVTLSADEYLLVLSGARAAPERAVVLTFDDGRGSLWTVGYPILRRYGLKGTVFLVPGRTASRPGPLPPTWDDVREGRAPREAILGREVGAGALLSWEEIEALAKTGVLDFQSHTLTHARVHTAPRVVEFMQPSMASGYAAMDVPLVAQEGHDLLAADVPLGTPLLRSEARTSEDLRFFEDPEIRRGCVEEVAEGGGAAFFTRPDWRTRLQRRLRRRPVRGRRESAEEQARAILGELVEARRMIETHTGRPVTHLCYPWHVSGPTAHRLAHEAGYRTAFMGKVAGTPITPVGGDPRSIARIGDDYLELLPGRGRARLSRLLQHKWSRRFGHGA